MGLRSEPVNQIDKWRKQRECFKKDKQSHREHDGRQDEFGEAIDPAVGSAFFEVGKLREHPGTIANSICKVESASVGLRQKTSFVHAFPGAGALLHFVAHEEQLVSDGG